MDARTQNALVYVSNKLSVPATWLYSLIDFESRWNPAARNPVSGARGLIQFMHQTARDLGYASADEIVSKYPDSESQLLGPVLDYFLKLPGKTPPYPTKQSLYMAVFFPAFRNVSPDTALPSYVTKQNPGIRRVSDYINYVERKSVVPAVGGLLLIVGIALWYIFKGIKL